MKYESMWVGRNGLFYKEGDDLNKRETSSRLGSHGEQFCSTFPALAT